MTPKSYVPVLRWKDAEMVALGWLRDEARQHIMPMVEITPKRFQALRTGPKKGLVPNPSEVLVEHAKEFLEHWGNRPFFLDLQHIDSRINLPNGQHPLAYLAAYTRSYRLGAIPTTGVGRSNEYQSAVSDLCRLDSRGACIRVSPDEVTIRGFKARLTRLLRALNLQKGEVDLFIDYGVFDSQSLPLRNLLGVIPELADWRSLIVCSGAFPPDLMDYQPGIRQIPREDWMSYRQQAREQTIARTPIFADYTIQHGLYKEPPEFCNPSASIRYALEETWLVMRGEGLLNQDGPGSEQWNANAQLLCEREEFRRFGPTFSEGDQYIFEMSLSNAKHGTPMTWLRAGINHHMTLTSRQLAGL